VPLGNARTTMDEARARLAQLGARIMSSAELGA
jgi:hypothetical protein